MEQSTGKQLDNSNENFKNAFEQYQIATQSALLDEVTKDKPYMNNNILPSSPAGYILKESKKSRKIAPIRKFLTTVKPVVSSLKPCYLMSPLSVSQYLEVAPQFDIVIFDEASQIQPWDAIGSMARGKQAIVVGDSKQLPPTSFFSNNSEDDDDEKIDCESVLEMFGTLFPELILKWHYRSRSESLIAFSNYHIYGNRLHTFPSSNINDQKVSIEVIEGEGSFYDRGKSKTNRKEAASVVTEVFKRLSDEKCSNSIGVVTFNTPQSTLIEDLIGEQLLKNSDFGEFFNPNNDEYVFVKNLESVQGDERDVILFSLGYGKDRNGVINKNFGPLNNHGGERRLNVAVTRAREEVKLFSNFHSRDFNVGSSKSEGLALLKEYMAFAEEGHKALFKRQQFDDKDQFDSPFEEEVAKGLRNKGWKVQTQVGVGSYRVDLGIVHPEHPGKFITGIECDGARYHSAKSARDRDILRQSVLEGLGWNILRIWSTDWWHNKNKVLRKINQQLIDLIQNTIEENNESVGENEANDIANNEEILQPEKNHESTDLDITYYEHAKISITAYGDFFESEALVRQQILHIVDILAPISLTECFSIIRNEWNFARNGNQIQLFLKKCSRGLYVTQSAKESFFWKSEEHFNSCSTLRLPKDGVKRHPKAVAPQELMFGFYPVVKQNKEVDKKELYRLVCKKLGFASLSKEAEVFMDEAADILVEKELVECDGDVIRLKF